MRLYVPLLEFNPIGEFGDLHRKLDEAYDKNDAAAVAALFTEDFGLEVRWRAPMQWLSAARARKAENFYIQK